MSNFHQYIFTFSHFKLEIVLVIPASIEFIIKNKHLSSSRAKQLLTL